MPLKFSTYFRGKSCEPFIAPLDVYLENEAKDLLQIVQPDLMVICDKTGLKENKYTGVQSLIVKIMSPLNYSHDRIKKYDMYMEFGVMEYWLVNTKLKSIEVYILSEGEYKQVGIYKENENAVSQNFKELSVNLKTIFA